MVKRSVANVSELCFASATQLAALVRHRRVSPLEVTRSILDQIERLNPALNAYCTIASDHALAAARSATAALRRGAKLGPLHGVPVSIKDLTPTKGIRTTFGSTIHKNHVPDHDALVVERLRAAGAIVLGKTNTPEFGAGANTYNALFGPTRNPWDPRLTCGGSTGGGAVALAAGMGPLAQGTDLGGSLRIPAAFCGVVGLRPSVGLVPIHPATWAWDTYGVQGPMARTVEDVALMLAVIAGPDPRAPLSYPVDPQTLLQAVRRPSVKGLRVAWSPDLGFAPVDDEIKSIAETGAKVFGSIGAKLENRHPDFSDILEIVLTSRGARIVTLHDQKLPKWRSVMQEDFVKNIDFGLRLDAAAIGRAERLRTELWHRVRTFFETHDVIVTPTTAIPPFPVDMPYPKEINGKPMADYVEWMLLTYAFTVIGVPAISVPCGFTRNGLPVGLQIAGRWHDDVTVLRAAAAFESATQWTQHRPPVTQASSSETPTARVNSSICRSK